MLSLQNSTQRFIGYLLQISAKAEDATKLGYPPTRYIASLLNLTPETLSGILSKLQQLALIEVDGNYLTIADVKKLRNSDLNIKTKL